MEQLEPSLIPFAVPRQVAEERLKVCKDCKEYKKPLCMKCGCIMPIKAQLNFADCPQNKWKM
jgi:hypothetical protein